MSPIWKSMYCGPTDFHINMEMDRKDKTNREQTGADRDSLNI